MNQRYLIPVLLAAAIHATVIADEFPKPVNTQAAGEHPPSPREMLNLFDLPEGFQVKLFAGEPDVRQPIAFDFDDRGRIWVAENYSYGAHGKYDPNLRDRIIILHDKDGDGEHDERKVFWDKGWMLTGLTWGYGGLWVLNDGTLSFIPDKNGDDIPDGEPVEMLNGWTKGAGHNFVNGLLWGPDGWLYGRHGITESSLPGTPDTPKEERTPFNCGIWRFHPTKHVFEVVCHGTTNPWGLDYNAHGDFFMTNNVIGHLYHVIPGAHYERMFGQDFNPHLYQLMGHTADHYHWDTTGKWSESRDGKANDLGGGHSHCGGMIYQGQNFPKEYRGKIFMCNTHGRCVNVNRLERKGTTYVGRREPNFLKVNTPWFRGVEMKYGPMGCVYLSDWSDNGECHDHDGVHRTSGRIYRISYGRPAIPDFALNEAAESRRDLFRFDLTSNPIDTLVSMSFDRTRIEWLRRKARRLVQEKVFALKQEAPETLASSPAFWRRLYASGNADPDRSNLVRGQFFQDYDELNALYAAWLMASVDALDEKLCLRLLFSKFETVRAFAVRHLCENTELRIKLRQSFHGLLRVDMSPVVAMAYASGLQKLAPQRSDSFGSLERYYFESRSINNDGARILALLTSDAPAASRLEDDESLRLMTWYGALHHDLLGFATSKSLELNSLRTRFVVEKSDVANPKARDLEFVIRAITPLESEFPVDKDRILSTRSQLNAILTALQGHIKIAKPANWDAFLRIADSYGDSEVTQLVNRLSVLFGEGGNLKAMHDLVSDRDGDHVARDNAIATLAQRASPDSIPVLLSVLNDRAVYVSAAAALASFDDPRIPKELLKRWGSLRHGSREAATDTLCSRRSYAIKLVGALQDGRVNSEQLSATHVRQLLTFEDPAITSIVESEWGVINNSGKAKDAVIASWKQKLTPDVLSKSNLKNGASLFKKICSNCHKLYGKGGKIGPDLTGSNRNNMDYLLGNIVAPSAVVPKQFTVTIFQMASGRVITGVVTAETDSVVTIQTDKDEMKLSVAEIEVRKRTTKSLMPDGLLDSLKPDDVRDLIGFVKQRR